MPSYVYRCDTCLDELTLWRSITSTEPMLPHPVCGGRLRKVLGPVRTYGVGERGAHTRDTDAKEAEWGRDMPAYRRLRDDGTQPPGIDGSAKLEQIAENDLEIRTGRRYGPLPMSQIEDAMGLAADIQKGRA